MRVLGIASGNGVIVYPFKKYLIAGIEIRSVFRTPRDIQWRLNFDNIPLFKSLDEYISWSIAQGSNKLPIDLIIGAPDCGHSSVLALSRAKKYSNPKSNESLTMFLKAVKHLLPNIFVMENLPKLLETFPEDEFQQYFEEYKLIFHKRSVMDFGNSQKNRVRLLVIGIKRGLDIPMGPLKRVYKVKKPKTAGELTKGLVYGENFHITEPIDSVITLYAGYKDNLKSIQKTWVEKDWTRWHVYDRNFQRAPGVYRNRTNQYPNTARKANRQFNPDGVMMSPRELARIMGVPDRFKLYYLKAKEGYCINKARLTVTKTCPMEIPIWLLRQLRRMGIANVQF